MTNGEAETVVSASLQKIKSIKNPILFYFIYFIKPETSDSFVNHFDGHFAYLKTLDFYFKNDLGNPYFSLLLYCIHVLGHDPITFSFRSFSFLVGWGVYGPII